MLLTSSICLLQEPVLSREALEAGKRLGRLPPLEGLGVVAWLLQALASDVRPADAAQVQPWLQAVARHASACAERCSHRPHPGAQAEQTSEH